MLSKCLNSIKLSVTVVCIISFLSSLLLCPVENHYTDIQSHSLMQAFCVYLHVCQETRGGDLTETIPERSALEGGSPEFTLKWSGQVLYSWNERYTSISFTRGIIHNHGGASGLLLTCILTAHLKINVTPRQTNAFYLFTFMSVQLIYANRQQ